MPISFGSKLSSAVANATFLDKTIDDETVGILGLNSPALASGSPVANPQGYINEIASTSGIDFFGDPDGTVYSSENYITNGDSRKVAIGKLDTQVKVNADNISSNSSLISAITPIIYANESLSAAGSITIADNVLFQKRRISGDGAPVTINDLIFGADPSSVTDGTEIQLIGTDATNTVTINATDVQYSAAINGNITLGLYHTLTLTWDAVLERFIEKARSN